jgi:hypothetical protein
MDHSSSISYRRMVITNAASIGFPKFEKSGQVADVAEY